MSTNRWNPQTPRQLTEAQDDALWALLETFPPHSLVSVYDLDTIHLDGLFSLTELHALVTLLLHDPATGTPDA